MEFVKHIKEMILTIVEKQNVNMEMSYLIKMIISLVKEMNQKL